MNAPHHRPPQHVAQGQHLLADLHGIEPMRLRDPFAIDQLLRTSAEAAGARILHSHFHSFGPGQGVTGVVLLAESHISIHTWPETGFAALDIFMCGQAKPELALQALQMALQPAQVHVQTVRRGTQAV